MMQISKAPLVAAFSEAGGLGCLATSGINEEEFQVLDRRIRCDPWGLFQEDGIRDNQFELTN